MRLSFIINAWYLILLAACGAQEQQDFSQAVGTWKAINNHADMDIIDASRFYLLVHKTDGTVDSIPFEYRLQSGRFDIFKKDLLVSKNTILTLTTDSFAFVRPGDVDTFRYVRLK